MKNTIIQDKKGFTLVELIVTIAIIGILAGIAIPRFMEANKSARGAKIIADMRTIDSSVNIYYVKYGKVPDDKDATGFKEIVNNGTWPTPPIGSFTIAHTMGPSGDPTIGVCDENTSYSYIAGGGYDGSSLVTLANTTSLSNCANNVSPTVFELLTNDSTSTAAYAATVSNIASLFADYNNLTNGTGIGSTYLSAFLNSDADRSVSEEFLEAYGIDTGFNEDLVWYADYNGNNNGTVLFLTTEDQFNSSAWTAVLVVTEDGTVYTSNATTTDTNGTTTTDDDVTYTDFSSIRAAVEGNSNPNDGGDINEEIGEDLINHGFTKQDTTIDI